MIAKLFISTDPVKPMDVFFSPSSVIRVYLSNAHLRPGSYQHQHPQVKVKTLQVAASPGLVGDERSQHSRQIECLEYFKWPNLWIPLLQSLQHIALKSSKRFAAYTFVFSLLGSWLMYSHALLIVSHFSSDEKNSWIFGVCPHRALWSQTAELKMMGTYGVENCRYTLLGTGPCPIQPRHC